MHSDVKGEKKKKKDKSFFSLSLQLSFWFVETFVHEKVTFTYE